MKLAAALAVLLAPAGAARLSASPGAAATPLSTSSRRVILFLGDSLTAGYGLQPEEAYPALLQKRWEKAGLPFTARNAGVSGATSAGAVERLEWALGPDAARPSASPGVAAVVVALGANDALRGLDPAETERNLAAVVRACRAKGVAVLLAGMKAPPNYGTEYTRGFEGAYARVARRHAVGLLPFLLEGVAGRPEMNLADGIHPNAAGQRRIAEAVHGFLMREGVLTAGRPPRRGGRR